MWILVFSQLGPQASISISWDHAGMQGPAPHLLVSVFSRFPQGMLEKLRLKFGGPGHSHIPSVDLTKHTGPSVTWPSVPSHLTRGRHSYLSTHWTSLLYARLRSDILSPSPLNKAIPWSAFFPCSP